MVILGSLPSAPVTTGAFFGAGCTAALVWPVVLGEIADTMSITNTIVSVPLMPAAELPVEPYPSAGGRLGKTRLPTFTPTRAGYHPGTTLASPIWKVLVPF